MNINKNRLVLLVIVLLVIGALFSGCMIAENDQTSDKDPGTSLPPAHEEPVKDPEPQEGPVTQPGLQEDPIVEPDSSQGSASDPDSGKDPATGPKPDKPDIESSKYTIYVDQQLIIPISGNKGADSIVVNSATVSSAEKQIALTFDAGWLYDQTTDLLDVLDNYQVKSTFFLRGKWVEDHPDLAKDILKRGHSVENHSLTHGHMKEMTDKEVRDEMIKSTNIIQEVTGYRPYLFRPPFGEYDNRILKILGEQGYPYTVLWTVDSLDWAEEMNGTRITEEYLIDRVLSGASDKGIVLMHVGGYQTVKALPEIIEGLQKSGYKLVKVNDMLPSTRPVGDQTIYTVKKGDTLTSIARKYGITIDEILEANPSRSKN